MIIAFSIQALHTDSPVEDTLDAEQQSEPRPLSLQGELDYLSSPQSLISLLFSSSSTYNNYDANLHCYFSLVPASVLACCFVPLP